MKITFHTQLEGIDWIASQVDNEMQFEILREELLFNFIYTQSYYIIMDQQKLQQQPA